MKKETLHLLPSLHSIVDGISGQAALCDFASHTNAHPQTDNHRPFSALNKPNRYNIAGPNNIETLTVPVTQKDKHNPINQVRINYNENWIKDHKQAWQTAYGKSPFFEHYDYRFWLILDAQPVMLIDLIRPWNQLLFAKLGIPKDGLTGAFSSTNSNEPLDTAARSSETPAAETQSLVSQNTGVPIASYPQVFDVKFGFRSEVSGIDLLFNQGPLAKEYLSQYVPTNTIFAP